MGGGNWDAGVYDQTRRSKRASGQDDFAYDATMHSLPQSQQKAHPTLDPKGVKVRESRDSDEHPTSTAIAIGFDETGSMGVIPRQLQQSLKTFFGLLLRKGYVSHPQILNMGFGDSHSDLVPLQVGQFESDNRIDENLENIFLEGNGGGQMHESYTLALYFIWRHTAIDCWEKRGDKGVLFLIGDELPWPKVTRKEVSEIIGDNLEEDVTLETILEGLKERWEVFFLMAPSDNYGRYDYIYSRWKSLLGERALELHDVDIVAEVIASIIGLLKGPVDDLDGVAADLKDLGVDQTKVDSTTKTLAPYVGKRGSNLAKGTGGNLPGLLPSGNPGTKKTKRLR